MVVEGLREAVLKEKEQELKKEAAAAALQQASFVLQLA
jgi:hypothetical protein